TPSFVAKFLAIRSCRFNQSFPIYFIKKGRLTMKFKKLIALLLTLSLTASLLAVCSGHFNGARRPRNPE
ncbi:MAG: hypothetical protein LUD69_00680, partial [Oscillospiraceae bacterium]|nr:hypothetical protein [Oscillospiraceae bacterium]